MKSLSELINHEALMMGAEYGYLTINKTLYQSITSLPEFNKMRSSLVFGNDDIVLRIMVSPTVSDRELQLRHTPNAQPRIVKL